jgi:hypothetical protein
MRNSSFWMSLSMIAPEDSAVLARQTNKASRSSGVTASLPRCDFDCRTAYGAGNIEQLPSYPGVVRRHHSNSIPGHPVFFLALALQPKSDLPRQLSAVWRAEGKRRLRAFVRHKALG